MTVTKELVKTWSGLSAHNKLKYKQLEANARQEYMREVKLWKIESDGVSRKSLYTSSMSQYDDDGGTGGACSITTGSVPTFTSMTYSSSTTGSVVDDGVDQHHHPCYQKQQVACSFPYAFASGDRSSFATRTLTLRWFHSKHYFYLQNAMLYFRSIFPSSSLVLSLQFL